MSPANVKPAILEQSVPMKRLKLLAIALVLAGPASALESAPPMSATPPQVYVDPATGMELVFVRGGCFPMGDIFDSGIAASTDTADEKPVHEVCLDDFYIGKHEVTQGQWKPIMGNQQTVSEVNCSQDNCPQDEVSFGNVQEFIRRLNSRSGGTAFRLPTEAEWEYAARSGGKGERYSGGNDAESVSWHGVTTGYVIDGSTIPLAHPVGARAPNGLGLYDMSGNMYEITSDWYGSDYYSSSPRNNPKGPATGTTRVIRGGCASGAPGNGRTSRRKGSDPSIGDALIGFRLVRVP